MNKPLISIVIPAYNEEKLIGKCIDEIKKQTLSQHLYEIIVCDNNSTDRTAEIARSRGVTVVSETANQGYVFSKDTGAKHAQGEFIGFVDADSTVEKHWLERAIKLLENPKVVCVGGTTMPDPATTVSTLAFKIFDYFAQLNQLLGISLIWTSGMVVRKKAFEEVGGYKAHMKTSDDWDLVMRLQKRYGRFSTLYTPKIRTFTEPRKQRTLSAFIPYMIVGIMGYFTIHVFRISKSFGVNKDIR